MHQQGRSNTAVVDMRLHSSHITNVAHRIGAIVVQVDDDRIVGNSEFVELGKQTSDVVVNVSDHRRDPSQFVELILVDVFRVADRQAAETNRFSCIPRTSSSAHHQKVREERWLRYK